MVSDGWFHLSVASELGQDTGCLQGQFFKSLETIIGITEHVIATDSDILST